MTPKKMIFLFVKHTLKCSIFKFLCDQFTLLENYSNFAVSMRNPILTKFGNLQEGFIIIALKLQEKLVVYDSYDKEIKKLISSLLYNYCKIEKDDKKYGKSVTNASFFMDGLKCYMFNPNPHTSYLEHTNLALLFLLQHRGFLHRVLSVKDQ